MLIDCHTHRPAPYPQGIISVAPDTELMAGQAYSVGLHPWHLPENMTEALQLLEKQVCLPQVRAVGEAGLDSLCHTPMWLQLKAFRRQAEVAEVVGKPLIVHCVRCMQEVCQLRRQLRAIVPWIIHGFRGKPTLLRMLLDAGCCVSYSDRFNVASLCATPPDRLFAETDDSDVRIETVLEALGVARGEDVTPIIKENMTNIFVL